MKFLLLNVHANRGLNPHAKKTKRVAVSQPLGILYIAAMLEDNNHIVEVIDYQAEDYSKNKLYSYLSGVDGVGISVDSFSSKKAEEIAYTIKQFDKEIPIIIGGPHCNFYPKKSLDDIPSADISTEGESEFAIINIVNALENGLSFTKIPGIHFREKNEIKKGKPPEIIHNLDLIPFPSRHLIEKYEYGIYNNKYLCKPKFTSIMTSRGCVFNCRFCNRQITGMKVYRERSIDNIIEEFISINDEYNSVMIVDDNFLLKKNRIHKILDKIIENKIDFEITIQGARVDTADLELYKKMKKAGVVTLNFGLESGNQDVLDFYNKKITLDQIRNAVKLSKKMGFETNGNFILGAPIETEKHINKTIKFVCSLPLDIASFTILKYTYHSDLWNEAFKEKKLTIDDGYSVPADSKKGLGNFKYEELENYIQKASKKFYYRPRFFSRQLLNIMKKRNLTTLRKLIYTKSIA